MFCSAITTHYDAKLSSVSDGGFATLTEQQILDVVRAHYDSLTLKLLENLDVYERYNEKPKEAEFFAALLARILKECREREFSVDQQAVLREFATIK